MIGMDTHTEAEQILAGARDLKAAEHAATAGILELAARWADLHPAGSLAGAATVTCRGDDLGFPIAGAGTPWVDPTCVAEFAAAVHTTTEGGQRLIGNALELRHRLPRLWALVHAGTAPAWQACRVADHTVHLTADAAGFVDAQVAACAGRIGPTRLDRLVQAAVAAFMPAEAERRQREQAEHRHFTITPNTGQDGLSGYPSVDGRLDLADALDLDAASADHARALARLGCTDSLDVRRARAAGDLARHQPALNLNTDTATDAATDLGGTDPQTAASRPRPPRPTSPRQRQRVVLYLHLSDTALTGHSQAGQVGRVGRIQNTQTPVTAQQIRDWCGQPDTQIIVKPVIDLNDTISVHAYEIPDRVREHLALRDITCVFPWCGTTAHPTALRHTRNGEPVHRTDCDHIQPYQPDGPPDQTSTDNLAPLCRRHHRLKTHTGWRYRVHDRPGTYLWTSPHGLTFLRDHTGTRETNPERARADPTIDPSPES